MDMRQLPPQIYNSFKHKEQYNEVEQTCGSTFREIVTEYEAGAAEALVRLTEADTVIDIEHPSGDHSGLNLSASSSSEEQFGPRRSSLRQNIITPTNSGTDVDSPSSRERFRSLPTFSKGVLPYLPTSSF